MPSKPQHKLLWMRKPMKNTEKPFAGKCFFFQGYTLQQAEIRLCRLECFGPIWSGERSSLEEAVRDRLVVSDWSRRWSVKVGTDGVCRCSAAEGLAGSWETWDSFCEKLKGFKNVADFSVGFFPSLFGSCVSVCALSDAWEPFLKTEMLLVSVGASHSSSMTFPAVGSNGCCLSAFFVLVLGVAVLWKANTIQE